MDRNRLALGLMLFSVGLSMTISSNISRLVTLLKVTPHTSTDFVGSDLFVILGLFVMVGGSAIIAYSFPKKP